jgi:hypothetical protein
MKTTLLENCGRKCHETSKRFMLLLLLLLISSHVVINAAINYFTCCY